MKMYAFFDYWRFNSINLMYRTEIEPPSLWLQVRYLNHSSSGASFQDLSHRIKRRHKTGSVLKVLFASPY